MRLLERKVLVGFIVSLAALSITSWTAYRNTRYFAEDAQWVTHTHEVLTQLEITFSTLKDAQRGMRGFVISDHERFLAPYLEAVSQVDRDLSRLKALTLDNPRRQQQIPLLESAMKGKLIYLRGVIDLRRKQGFEAAQGVISTGSGEESMDEIRRLIDNMKREEYALLEIRQANTEAAGRRMVVTFSILTALVLVFLSSAYMLIRADAEKRNLLATEREQLIQDLKDALTEVKQLQGILPICSYCKQIRNDQDSWQQIESYVADHTDAKFSHGICPSCYERVVKPQLEELRTRKWKQIL